MKRYGQFCSLARAAEILGERWALLIVRELLLGPKRYSDLMEALPGISTNVLATRLRDLEDETIIRRRVTPPPTPATLYELTDDGIALKPAMDALADWGLRRLGAPSADEVRRPGWLLLGVAASTSARQSPADAIVQLVVDGEAFAVTVDKQGMSVTQGTGMPTAATVRTSLATLYALATGSTTVSAARSAGDFDVEGDRRSATVALEAIAHARIPSPTPHQPSKRQL